jgi:hypothetical protein
MHVPDVSFLYLPALHAAHVPPAGPLYPRLQIQSVTATLTGTEKLFDGQLTQAASPDAVLYFPASQAEHEPPFTPVYPATQEQFVSVVLPLGELLLDPQALQPWFPMEFLYVPAAQALQDEPAQPNPGAHVQLLGLAMPLNSVVVIAAQSVHGLLLTSLLNFPAGHVSHVYAVVM